MSAKLNIYNRMVRHCSNHDEFSYIRELSEKLLSESDFHLFLYYCTSYFSMNFFNHKYYGSF